MADTSNADATTGPVREKGGDGLPPAAASLLGANPFVGLTPEQAVRALVRWAGTMGRHPAIITAEFLQWSSEEVRVLAGVSRLGADPKDRRFDDPAWRGPLWRRLAQSYLATGAALLRSVDELGLDPKSADRARFALTQIIEAMAPTNALPGNPAAMKRAWKTRGRSLVAGARNLGHDILHNGGMPSQVDSRPFRVGETVAVSPGAVVYRTEVFELLQYEPATPTVSTVPTVVVPPQINRFYFLDMAPGRSFVEYCVQRGVPMFMISWRNPTRRHRDWGLDTYAGACLEALTVAAEIMGSDKTNVIGFCAGGMTEAALLSHLAQTDNDLVNAAGVAVSLMDTEVKSSLTAFMSQESLRTSLATSRRKGVLSGQSLGRVFSWVRPNDLVWNYWVSNYLLGETPAPFDVLAWNADTTNLPAALHADFLDIWEKNAMMAPGSVKVMGSPLNLSTVKNEMYVVGAITDHLVPWESAYGAVRAFGGPVRFVLSRSGHVQALVNPPGNPKASFYLNPDHGDDPAEWLVGALQTPGSWWEDWADWVLERSGPTRPAPESLGDPNHAPIAAAPGTYVHER
jgi:poly[(R)-3-hydroxyalkanoate] polymerase subunit PhaC